MCSKVYHAGLVTFLTHMVKRLENRAFNQIRVVLNLFLTLRYPP